MSSIAIQRAYLGSVVVVLLAVSLLSFTQPVQSERPAKQEQLFVQVPTALDPEGAPPVAAPAEGPGSALAYMEIPRFGSAWLWTVVEGVDLDDLALGPGHYPGTPLPGARGNLAIAGHRAGHGDPFIDFDLLRVGDTVTLRQSGAWWTYRVYRGPERITPDRLWVLRQPALGRRLTLTTCWPRYGNSERLFVRARLVDWSGR